MGFCLSVVVTSQIEESTFNHTNKMKDISRKCCTVALILSLLSSTVFASLRHKSSKYKFLKNDLDSSSGSKDTCKRSEPCGWALYTPGSSPRKIYKYTRNIFCSCSGGDVCSLTRDALQQNSFVFYCRPKETSRYRFPRSFFYF